jgi:hypothetical protein
MLLRPLTAVVLTPDVVDRREGGGNPGLEDIVGVGVWMLSRGV